MYALFRCLLLTIRRRKDRVGITRQHIEGLAEIGSDMCEHAERSHRIGIMLAVWWQDHRQRKQRCNHPNLGRKNWCVAEHAAPSFRSGPSFEISKWNVGDVVSWIYVLIYILGSGVLGFVKLTFLFYFCVWSMVY